MLMAFAAYNFMFTISKPLFLIDGRHSLGMWEEEDQT